MIWDWTGHGLFCVVPYPKQPLLPLIGYLQHSKPKCAGLSCVPLDYKDPDFYAFTLSPHRKTP